MLDALLTTHLAALLLGLASLALACVVALVLRRVLARRARPELRAARQQKRARLVRLRGLVRAVTSADRGRGAPEDRPWWLVIGPPGHGKTALLTAIDGARELVPGPTDEPRFFLAPTAILIECPSEQVSMDTPSSAEPHLLAHLRRVRPAQPIHGVLLVLRADALPAEPELAELRQRLTRVSRALAVQIPLVVVVTQLDRLAGLTELTADLSSRDGVLGVVLPPRARAPAASLRDALLGDEGPVAWARRRSCALLARARPDDPLAARLYGLWPRLEALAGDLSRALGHLVAPHASADDPLPLRAVYFTSSRPTPAGPTTCDLPPTALDPRPVDPTRRPAPALSGFKDISPADPRRPPDPQLADGLALVRRPVPGDTSPADAPLFVADLFAAEVPRTSLAAARLRRFTRSRAALAAAAALALCAGSLLLAAHTTRAAQARRDLARGTSQHARAVAFPSGGPLPALGDLVGLADAALAWSDLPAAPLPSDDALPPAVRAAFQGALCRDVLHPLAARIERSLRDLTARHADGILPEAEWPRARDRLRLLLLLSTPAEPDEPDLRDMSQASWAEDQITAAWSAAEGDAPDHRRSAVLRRHLDLLAHAPLSPSLARDADPCARSAHTRALGRDAALVAAARGLLRRRPSERVLVDRMIDAIARERGLRAIDRPALTTAASLSGDARVHPAFTREGWEAFRAALRGELRARDDHAWVLGQPGLAPPEGRCARLRAVYVERHEAAWRDFLAALRLRTPSSLPEAARVLAELGEKAPLRPVFQALRQHTQDLRPLGCPGDAPLLDLLAGSLAPSAPATPDAAELAEAFADLVAFGAPPARPGEQSASGLDVYHERLLELRAALARALDNRAELPALQAAAVQVRRDVDDLLHRSSLGAWAEPMRRLLIPPLTGLELLVHTAAGRDLHAEWCAAVVRPLEQTLASRYPFRADARLDARLDDLTRLLHPQSGEIARFRDTRLGGFVGVHGDAVAARELGAGAALHLHPRALALLGAAHELGLLLFPGDAPGLVADLTMTCDTAVHKVSLIVDGAEHTYTCSIDQAKQIAWPGARDPRGATLIAHGPAGRRGELPALGEFGLFRLLERHRPEGRPGAFRVVFDLSRQGLGALEVGVRPRPVRGGDLFHGRDDREFLAPFRAAALLDPTHVLFSELSAACP